MSSDTTTNLDDIEIDDKHKVIFLMAVNKVANDKIREQEEKIKELLNYIGLFHQAQYE